MQLIVQVNKITTTVDGGWRISFDVDQSQTEAIGELSLLRDQNLILDINFEQSEIESLSDREPG